LVAMTMTKEQCGAILKPLLAAGLPVAGFIRTFPWAVVHGLHKKQGLQIPILHMEQMISQIKTMLQHSRKNQDPTNFLIQACYELLQIESG